MASISSIFELDEYKPFKNQWRARQAEINRCRGYYDGTAYKRLATTQGFFGPKLYKNIRGLYLPLSRAVDTDCGLIPGGWKLLEDVERWAQPLIDQVFTWSRWVTEGVLITHYGASTGVAILKIVDDRINGKVYMQPVDPAHAMLVSGVYDPQPTMAITALQKVDADGEYEYAEVITPDSIRTYRAGQPYGYGGRPAEYENTLGFVPMVEAGHIRISNTSDLPGVPTFVNAIPLLDECNQLASYLLDIVKRNAEPQWIISGAAASELSHDGQAIWFLPKDAKAEALTPAIDIDGVLDFVKEVRDQVVNGLPELAYDDLRKQSQIATATLTAQLGELCNKINRIRHNYDMLLVEGLRLAGRAAATMGLPEVSRLAELPDKTFDPDRPVLPLDPETALRIESMQLSLKQQRKLLDNFAEGAYPVRPFRKPDQAEDDQPDQEDEAADEG